MHERRHVDELDRDTGGDARLLARREEAEQWPQALPPAANASPATSPTSPGRPVTARASPASTSAM